jgi:hypothetical protein
MSINESVTGLPDVVLQPITPPLATHKRWGQFRANADVADYSRYPDFLGQLSPDALASLQGKVFAASFDPSGNLWSIVAIADDFDALRQRLGALGLESTDVVYDSFSDSSSMSGGIQIR